MSRHTDAKCRLCRRHGSKLFKGPRCYTDKCAMEKRPFPPGVHKGLVEGCPVMVYSLRKTAGTIYVWYN